MRSDDRARISHHPHALAAAAHSTGWFGFAFQYFSIEPYATYRLHPRADLDPLPLIGLVGGLLLDGVHDLFRGGAAFAAMN